MALGELSLDADYAGDHDEAVRLARQAGQITAGVPGAIARYCSFVLTIVLAGAGDLAEAERVGAAGLAQAWDAGDLRNQALLLIGIVNVDLRAGRTGGAGLWAAQRPGPGAGRAGRLGPDQRGDRRRAAHQRPHRRLAPGPDPGQDRLPPRRPDPPGPHRTPGLARPRPTPVPVGRLIPAAAATQKGSADPCSVHRPADQSATDRWRPAVGMPGIFLTNSDPESLEGPGVPGQ